jgi:hypothetical protein
MHPHRRVQPTCQLLPGALQWAAELRDIMSPHWRERLHCSTALLRAVDGDPGQEVRRSGGESRGEDSYGRVRHGHGHENIVNRLRGLPCSSPKLAFPPYCSNLRSLTFTQTTSSPVDQSRSNTRQSAGCNTIICVNAQRPRSAVQRSPAHPST